MLPIRCARLRQHVARQWPLRTAIINPSTINVTIVNVASTRGISTTPVASRSGQPFRMAIIGSGPAGFYTAYRAMARIQDAKVDMYEALPVPFGLVRFGVAPDHPEVKNCQEKFEEVASSPNFTFIGNVSIGNKSDHSDGCTIPLASILRHYHAIVFSYGAAKDRTLDIPGENLKGVYSAREFVGWYNGLPEHANLNPDLTKGEEAVIIGQGNVALDVARMLLEDVDVLRKSDIAEHAIETLSQSKVKRVHIVGRRGPMQAAFTSKEIRELKRLPRVAYLPIERSLIPPDLKAIPRAPRRLMGILSEDSSDRLTDAENPALKSWSLDFLLSPTAFLPSESFPDQLAATQFARNTLSPSLFDPQAYALPDINEEDGQPITTTLKSPLAFRSIGYRAQPLPEFAALEIPFDDRHGVISNDGPSGRVRREVRGRDAAMTLGNFPGLYCAGWVKRGPTGVIASTMEDAFATAEAVAEDWHSGNVKFLHDGNGSASGGESGTVTGWEGVKAEVSRSSGLDKARVVDWEGWKKIDAAERERGEGVGKEREKFTSTAQMLGVLG
ncbi:hypothetical protein B0J18DRAFT_40393 [Chaetomium sp. MPI-SDFR-AT-0129]|nr:hypothetical protein B0J18DRAFT_40393 [Chaetomium sp. MPI-SDFR-AT-0129]